MIIDLSDTNASAIASALVRARRNAGSPAMGMVLTLIVVADENTHYDAIRAAMQAAKEHPSRIIGVIPQAGRGPARLDAEVRVGGEGGPGESLLLRLYGELSRHPESVVTPLLLPESPVVTWWPGRAPSSPSTDPLGALAQRRITDCSAARHPLAELKQRCRDYAPGDTDLAWTRITPWRALLAAALDQPHGVISGATIETERSNASADLLGAWLSWRLRIPVTVKQSPGPGITAVHVHTEDGDIAINRPDGRVASYSIPFQPERSVALKRRETSELLAEELRRLDPDEIYARTVEELLGAATETPDQVALSPSRAARATGQPSSRRKRAAAKKTAAKKAAAKETAAKKTAAKKRAVAKNAVAKKATTKKAARTATSGKATTKKTATKKTAAKKAASRGMSARRRGREES